MESCQFGVQKNNLCCKLSYVKPTGLKNVEGFVNDAIKILRRSLGLEKWETICLYHEYILLIRFLVTQTICCDPFKKHETKLQKRKPSCEFKFYIMSNYELFYFM